MKNSLKGALLSGLVFPGLGQVALKHYRRGILLMLTVSACMVVMVVKAVKYALGILETIGPSDGIPDLNSIAEAAREATSASDNTLFNSAFLLIVLTWILSILDAYRIGKKMDLQDYPSGRQVTSP